MSPFAERLKRARKAAGLSLRKAGELAQVSHAAIQKYEEKGSYPSSDILLRLAKAYGIRMEYFFRPQKYQLGEVKFRKRKKLPKKKLDAIEHEILDQIERRLEIEELCPSDLFQPFRIPQDVPSQIEKIDRVEEVAKAIRTDWNLGLAPIANLVDLLEEHGIRVFMIDVGDPKFDGLAGVVDSGMPIIVVDASWHGDRQRFTLAHELGHLILEGRLSAEIEEEKAANRFSGAFLIPQDILFQEIGKVRTSLEMRELFLIKEEYGISMLAQCCRLHNLDVISDHYFRELMIHFNRQGWMKREPGKPYPSESVHIFKHLVLHALSEEIIGESKAAELLNMTAEEFREYRNLCHENAACQRC